MALTESLATPFKKAAILAIWEEVFCCRRSKKERCFEAGQHRKRGDVTSRHPLMDKRRRRGPQLIQAGFACCLTPGLWRAVFGKVASGLMAG